MNIAQEIRDLLYKIRLGEDSTIEFKAVRIEGKRVTGPRRDSLADEIAAFANSNDGVILLGVDDKSREVTGVPLDKLDAVERLVHEVCFDSLDPPVPVRILRLELPDHQGVQHPVLKVDIKRSLFVHRSPGGYLYRVGSDKRRMSTDYLGRLMQQRSQSRLIRFDEQAVPGVRLADLNRDLRQRFIGEFGDDDDPTVLRKLHLLVNDDTGNEVVSVAGVLMCSERPEQWLPSAFIQAVCYDGAHLDANDQVDARDITGPLDRQIHEALHFVQSNMRVAARKHMGRVDYPQYALNAVFEAITNAVAHRDYSIYGSKIRLFMFADRLELYSPGAIPNTMTVESLALRQATRNELITSLLAKCPVDYKGIKRKFVMDKRGEGVPLILRESTALSGHKPVYDLIDDSELRVTIFAGKPPEE